VSFKTNAAADVSAVFMDTTEFAQSFTTSAGATISGILDYGQDLAGYDLGGQAVMASLSVSAAEYADPQRYDTLNDGTYSWRVERIINGDGYMWLLALIRDQRAS
jgi:hypothetical protein